MIQRRRVPIVLLLLAIAGSVLYLANREPSYNGRSLSSWLKELDYVEDGRSEAHEAIRHIGTNALSYLLQELRRKDSAGKRTLMEWNDQLESRLEHDLMKLTPAESRRAAAAEAFRALGSNAVSAIPALCQNLADRELAEPSAQALALIGQPALAAIKEQAQSTNDSARWACAYALWQFTNANEIVPTFQKLAADTQPEVRSMAAHGLGQLASVPETSVPILVNLLSDTNRSVQRAACRGLCGFGTNAAPAAPALSNIFVSNARTDSDLRYTAGLALQRIGPSTIPIFLKLLSHPDSFIRADAVRSLGRFQDEATNHVAEMLPLLRDPDAFVCMHALMSLRVIRADPAQFMPALVEALKLEENENTREHFLTALKQFGETATNALPTLIALAGKSEGDSRISLLMTIAAIDEGAAKKLGAEPWLLDMARASRQQLRQAFWHTGETSQTNVQPSPPISVPPPSP